MCGVYERARSPRERLTGELVAEIEAEALEEDELRKARDVSGQSRAPVQVEHLEIDQA